MIGIINDKIEAFVILDTIRKKYPTCNIYISSITNSITESISKIKEKCQIIIIPENYNLVDLQTNYPNIYFLKVPKLQEDGYTLDDNALLEAISLGKLDKVEKILNTISTNQTIILNNPKLLLIKDLISSKLSNKIMTSMDQLLSDLDYLIKKNNIQITGNTITNIIR